MWLGLVIIGTGIAGRFEQLPGVESRPYILRFCEDKPNPLYRRVCYTFAWNALLNFALLNLAGLVVACFSGKWILKQIYAVAYFPLLAVIVLLGMSGALPRVRRSTQGEGIERRYFYGAVGRNDRTDDSAVPLEDASSNTPDASQNSYLRRCARCRRDAGGLWKTARARVLHQYLHTPVKC